MIKKVFILVFMIILLTACGKYSEYKTSFNAFSSDIKITLYEKNKKEFFHGFHNNKEKEKHILTQCVGVTSGLRPYVKVGRVTKNTNFLLCSDGFYQKLKKKEIKMYFSPKHCRRKERIRYALRTCIKLVKEREEMDNISAVVVTCR